MSSSKGIDRRSFCAAAAMGSAALGMGALVAPAIADEAASAGEAEATAGEPTAMAGAPVFVVDRVITKPGDGEAFFNDYMETYVPVAQAYGAELVSALVAPPIWLPMDSNTITFTWKVAGIAGSWGISGPRFEMYDWWKSVHERVVEQDRSYFADPADFEELSNV